MIYSTLSLAWLLFYLCASVAAAPIAPVRRDAVARAPTPDSEPSTFFTPTEPISKRYVPSRIVARSADDAKVLHYLHKRKLFITMLNGGPVESRFVNLLDLWHIAEKAIERTPEGSPRRAELVDFQLNTATELTRLMEGVALLQSSVGTPTPTPPLEIDPEPAFTAAESTPTTTETAPPATSPPTQGNSSTDRILISQPASSSQSDTPQPSSPAADPAPTATPEPSPAPASQQPNPGSANGGVANGNERNASSIQSPSASGSANTSNTVSNLAEAAQATETVDAGSATRFSVGSWVIVGALLVWGCGVL